MEDTLRRQLLQCLPDGAAADAEPPPAVAAEPFVRETPKVGRNEPCPCESGKKFKHCHGGSGAGAPPGREWVH